MPTPIRFEYICKRPDCKEPVMYNYSERALAITVRFHNIDHEIQDRKAIIEFERKKRIENPNYSKLKLTVSDLAFLKTRGILGIADKDIELA
jgi:hypothetical protein